jgi:D-threo-aldose 1-dehydrogenase
MSQSFDLELPPIIFGTSGLGNLFIALDYEEKLRIVREIFLLSRGKVVFDSAGKYGAGLALETLGKCLEQLEVAPDDVMISNKLGWLRTELEADEPTFEPGIWKNLKHDAVQKISYEGIMECFEQGNSLLGKYRTNMVSVHDPDEYLAAANNSQHSELLYNDILDAYHALFDLKQMGEVQSIGVGAKDWRIVKRIATDVQLDWVMIANSMTIKYHPQELLDFISGLRRRGVHVINSAVFHSGFLVGGDYYDYHRVEHDTPQGDALLKWREDFFAICNQYNVDPAVACVQFALNVPGVKSIALNTMQLRHVRSNLSMIHAEVPTAFWEELTSRNLVHVAVGASASLKKTDQP